MKASRFTNALFALLFLGAGVFAAVFLYRDYQHFDNLRSENVQLTSRKAALEQEADKREAQLEKLQTDSEYVESVIRTKLNYAKDGEVVFRFEH